MSNQTEPRPPLRQKGSPTMPSPTDSRLADPRDLLRALVLLTRLPVPGADGARAAASAWAWPAVGVILGGLAGALAWAALMVGLPSGIAAGLAMAAGIAMTGGLHEDGLADCADGFWGGAVAERRLEIMKDSRIGAFGVLALTLVIGLKWLALTVLIEAGALWAAVLVPTSLSRAAMAGVMVVLPFARQDGLARQVGKPPNAASAVCIVLAALFAIVVSGVAGVVAVVAVGAAAIAVARLAQAKVGGQTGDVLGAAQQVAELAALLSLVGVLSA
jgi:adenosylcobinamide-GDP ribazoletransferase